MPDKLKAAAVNLTASLYIDANPQTEQRIPNLVRIWADIKEQGEVTLPAVEPEREGRFKALQDVIRAHLTKKGGRLHGDVYTMQLMGLLQKLMKFCFYTTAKQMTGVVIPLLDTLDDRQLYAPQNEEGHASLLRLGSHSNIAKVAPEEPASPGSPDEAAAHAAKAHAQDDFDDEESLEEKGAKPSLQERSAVLLEALVHIDDSGPRKQLHSRA